MTEYATILTDVRGPVGWITLHRPEALNALSTQVMLDVVAAAEAFDADEAIGAIVLTGSDRAFAAGADIAEMQSMTGPEILRTGFFADWSRFAAVRTPVIAAVAGFALGGGCEVALMCDLILAADTAKFGQPEINLAVIPGMGGTQRLLRAVGYPKAADLVLTGRMIDADEADRIGLVSRVVPAEELLDEAQRIGEGLAAKSAPSVHAAKAALDVAMETSLAGACASNGRRSPGYSTRTTRRRGWPRSARSVVPPSGTDDRRSGLIRIIVLVKDVPNTYGELTRGTAARLGDSSSHAAGATVVFTMASNSTGVKRPT